MPLTAYDLSGRTAFVTGAATGIGRASAVLLARAGATVHCADRDARNLHETAALIKEAGSTAHTHHLDVTDRKALRQAVGSCERLDVMAAIAGIMHTSTVMETRDEDLDRVLDVNFKGVLYACQEAVRQMLSTDTAATSSGSSSSSRSTGSTGDSDSSRSSRGSIITMASGAVDTGRPGLLCYGVAKAAVVQLTKTLAQEVGRHGIRVNAVAPGWIRTPMTDRQEAGARERTETAMARMAPLGRVGEPDDVAHAVLHLASDASSFTTGQILRPNGGVAMPW
ncbi:SDR family NAD(P)-dependent oxidoreductase [Streptomyces sp. DSM 41014]|uniref:SDR family NAD(P)-dependent oxidoreductase n=1 Tax=Streptomyces hintoniae TaxID=3075521 RepID=A0ABU2UWY3_9ACTN|nr:SDR family NAD(P)-dependent oxidoreductase [Streptomyces sp. DSM 41014]MDT0477813.1 SDR family NAD(P)-dependent oxidoreductase [Streptomyces sp. DSM 41014]